MSSAAQLRALRSDDIDLGFVRMPIADDGLDQVPIIHERMVAAVGPGSPWRDRRGLASLSGEPFVVCSRAISASYYDHVVALCRAAGFTPRIVTETNDLFSQIQLVRAGIGVALVPSAAALTRTAGVRFQELRTALAAWEIALVWRRQPDRHAAVDAFVRVARQVQQGA